ncbi:hypothetical protein BC939DRAFT_469268 [Gamsiella multidivaricata]|uniref:uncharacterized protein n=1 Tax=Gamsiella multidivaricata TaxID=101098 RepID=UPI002221081C|nr:uncharacterized protein BC939DRAFT_469253 [Gamsiella multidivaricata]XP_051406482.1 uncharacterized protein BC939DRAFT_469268 [Gamsiella multidivaricata]KAG0349275.1 hypothetical protein BGZ54_004400 [Gamsiella multidivaricata]KAI7816409.1 hypothetical protein BC939DRAFT_469253 [Gamsiella multidivaricata]KAI7816411.1 hypothetical protein BC939DRAFT_469268 [Gamsiella multidivaricata]
MRFAIACLAVLLATVSTIKAQDQLIEYGICSCFNPKYDASCCIVAKGSMYENVCDTPDFDSSVEAYKACCSKSGGRIKCKPGYRDPKNPWPPKGSYSCSKP